MPEGFKIASAFVEVDPATEGFREKLQEALDQAVAGVDANVRVGLDTAELDAKADEVRARVDELNEMHAAPKVGLNIADLDARADEAKAKVDELDGKRATPEVGLSTAALDAKDDEARAKLDELDGKRAEARISLDTSEFNAKMDEAEARLEAFKTKSASPRIGGSGGGGGEGGRAGHGSLGSAIALGLGTLMPGLGGAVAGLAGIGGVGAMALGPVGRALSDARQATHNVGFTPQQLASTEFDNAVQIQQAQHTVALAHEQAAQDAITSANSIQMAQMNLAQVERNSAEQQIQALQSVKMAQQGVEEADYNLSEAQYNLNQAWEKAREQIRQLNDQLADSKLNVQQAELAIKQAEYHQRLINQNAYSTSIDRQQAALDVARAHQQLTDAQDQETAAAYAANRAHKEGVGHSQIIIQAKQAVTAATYGQQDANFAYADAQRRMTLTQLNDAAQIKAAQMQLAMAEEQASYQRRRDAEQVHFAEQSLTNTIKAQQLAWASMMSTENQAANQFKKDMSLMSPAAQDLVRQILSMRGEFKQLQTTGQNAVAPGLTKFFQGLQVLMPTLQKDVGKLGGLIGDTFAGIGRELAKPATAHVLDGLVDNGIKFAKIVGPAFGGFLGILAKIGAQKGAADGLGNLLAGIAKGLSGMAAEIGKNQKPINDLLTSVGTIIAQIGPSLGRIISDVAKALGPLTRYLNAHPNGTVVKVIADIIAGMITLKGLAKVLPNFITGPLFKAAGKVGSKAGDLLLSPFKKAAGKIPGLMGKAWDLAGQGALKAGLHMESGLAKATGFFKTTLPGAASKAWDTLGRGAVKAGLHVESGLSKVSGFFTDTLPTVTSRGAGALKTFATNGATAVAGWGSRVGTAMGSAASSVGQFVAGFGRQMLSAMKSIGTWIATQTAATATFITEKVSEAAAATAAFIAENLATIGIVAAIGLVVAAILYLATHWKQVWKGIEDAAMWLWHKVLDPFWQGIVSGVTWIYDHGIKYYFDLIKWEFHLLENAVLWTWHHIFEPFWQGIEQGASGFVSAFKDTWSTLQKIFKDPVSFLVNTVYGDGIAKLWNDVVGALGADSLKLPIIHGFAHGGVVPGYAPGQDTVPAMLSPGEGVLVPEAVQAIGPATVHQLNATYGGGRTSDSGHFSGGGIVGDAAKAIGDFFSGASKVTSIVTDLATGDTKSLVKVLTSFVSSTATGNYAKMLLGVPKALIHDAVKAITDFFSSSGGGISVPGHPSGSVQSWFQKAVQLTGVPAGWLPGLETIGYYESGDNPNAINNYDINAQNGDPSRGIMQTIMSTFRAYHQPGTSDNIYDPVANISSAINYIRSVYHDVGNVPGIRSLAHGGPYVGYDSGGWLMPSNMPGAGMPVNMLGKPEAVLTPAESEAFVQIVRLLTREGIGNGSPLGHRHAEIHFHGTQHPNPEQMAAIQREMGLALSGV